MWRSPFKEIHPYRGVWLLLLPLAVAISPLWVNIHVELGLPVHVTETFIFSQADEANITTLVRMYGFRHYLWQKDVPDLVTHVCKAGKTDFYVKAEGPPTLVLEYYCVPEKTKEEFLSDTYRLNFKFPREGGFMKLPPGYSVTFEVPRGGAIVERVPEGEWKGPLSSAKGFYVYFTLPRRYMAPSLSKLIIQAVDLPLLVLILLLLLLRKKVIRAAEKFSQATTEIKKE